MASSAPWFHGLPSALGVSLALALSACQSDSMVTVAPTPASTPQPVPCNPSSDMGGPYCLTFLGSAYDVHIGQKFKVDLVSADGNNTVITSATIGALPGAAFAINLPQSMVAGVPYYVDYYADNTRDGICEAPALASDHVWRSHIALDFFHGTITTVTATAGDVLFSAPHDDPFVNDPIGMDTCPQLNQVP